jgi:8-oxo-dGTP pyrophosphatase MutT (NUDIX family)
MVWTPRATVAAVIERDGKFLMVEEPADSGTVFNQPAGHLEKNESLLQAVIREVNEETAWQFTPEYILGFYQWQHPSGEKTYMRTTYVGRVDNHRPEQTLEDGILRACWMTRDELVERTEQLRSPMVLQCIDDYLGGARYPLELYQCL